MTVWDAPNQQVVRADGSGPGVGDTPPDPGNGEPTGLDAMTKDELLAYAQEIGASPANAAMTKADIRASIDAKLAETSA